jgi:hypothetical protein
VIGQRDAQGAQRSRDAGPGGLLGHLEAPRQLGIGQLGDDAQLDGLPLVLGEHEQARRDGGAQLAEVGQLLDPGELLGTGGAQFDAQALPRPAVDVAPAQVGRQLAVGDRVQPRSRLLVAAAAEGVPAREGQREGLGREVEGGLGVDQPAREEPQEPSGVVVVELREGRGLDVCERVPTW